MISFDIGSGNGLVPWAPSHYLSQYWPRSTSPYDVTTPQRLSISFIIIMLPDSWMPGVHNDIIGNFEGCHLSLGDINDFINNQYPDTILISFLWLSAVILIVPFGAGGASAFNDISITGFQLLIPSDISWLHRTESIFAQGTQGLICCLTAPGPLPHAMLLHQQEVMLYQSGGIFRGNAQDTNN